ncbi:MATE family efflux transporter [Puniceibacterium sp. IMCC21224]|uniref:MATE family efflux transporter n=1 Tax=Puniceibacterium sp. IMCC21224 TaxID=1618204 RepID=UPI00064DD8CA|nr:MATE family efflux transporter [Puniceibacterium sp. IMCC21224]KMK66839.1 putative efflux protein, MATE family [Puniceibacterium sp. IMCC21224]
MKRAPKVDLTIGPMSQHFRTLAVPAALGMVFNTAYNMVDMYFAGRLETSSQAGLSIGFGVFFVYVAFGFGLGSGVSALVGGALGARDARQARRLTGQALIFAALISGVLMAVGLILSPWIVQLVSEPGAYRDAAARYLLVLQLAIPGFVVAYACNGALQAQGDSVSLTRALGVAFLANVILNPLLIYGLPGLWGGIGFDGLAVSTVLSQTGVMVFMLWRLLGSEVAEGLQRRHFRPRVKTFRILAVQMLPTSFSLQVMILAGIAVQFALKGFGGHAIAAYGVGLRIEQMVLLPILGVATSLLPIAAQNFGARDFDRVRAALAYGVKVALTFMAITCPILWLGADWAMGVFTDDPEVRAAGVSYLHFDTLLLPVYAMLFLINSLLQALKRPIYVLWISIYRQGFGVAFFVWLYLNLRGWDLWSVWFGIGTSVMSGLVLSLLLARHVAGREIGGLWSKPADHSRT